MHDPSGMRPSPLPGSEPIGSAIGSLFHLPGVCSSKAADDHEPQGSMTVGVFLGYLPDRVVPEIATAMFRHGVRFFRLSIAPLSSFMTGGHPP